MIIFHVYDYCAFRLMSSPLTHKLAYLEWAISTFGAAQVQQFSFDEAGYPAWHEVERDFATLAQASSFTHLDPSNLNALLYLIARSWDSGRMIAWLSNGPQLSNLAKLAEDDALLLGEAAASLNSAEYEDATYQFAKILPRITALRPRAIALGLRMFASGGTYTKRVALKSLGEMGHANITSLVERLWQVPDEHARITCLEVLERFEPDLTFLKRYIPLADVDIAEGDHLRAHLAALRKIHSLS